MNLQVLGNTLDEEQTKAAITNDKNTIIIAGAGSGKSLTMVGKIKYLVNNMNVPLNDILCITFTNAAALSLENKIKKELGLDNKVYTFHKLGLEILKEQHIDYKIAPIDLLDYLANEIFIAIGNQSFFQKYFWCKNYQNLKEFNDYKATIIKFIRLYICKQNENNNFQNILKKAKRRDKPFLKITKKIYKMYELEKKSQGLIDFDDMISLATKVVREQGINKNYRYVIIDEYQDTSNVRENLVREIIKKTHAYITVVGDDFQSIYRFSGCDVANFLEFTKNFQATELFITNTYRNSNELIKVAGSFIMANPRQIKKNLKSNKSISKPIVVLYYENEKTDFIKALNVINSERIMVLGRNNADITRVLANQLKMIDNIILYQNKTINYQTIHKSKGLEEDNVLIINLTNNVNSLPSKIKEDKILKYVTDSDIYPYEEERRLFYVALTRTKNYCYLYVNKKNSSIFVKELIRKYKKYITFIKL